MTQRIPEELFYTPEHEWAHVIADNTIRVGITDFAQSALGDVVFLQLPDVNTHLTAGTSFGEVESTKSVSDLYAPLTGTVIAVNTELEANPQLVNSDPYGAGWIIEIQCDHDDQKHFTQQLSTLLTAQDYRALLQKQS